MSIGVKKTKGQLIRAVNRIQGKELCETMKLAQRKFVRPDSDMAICRLTKKNGTECKFIVTTISNRSK